MAHENDTIGVQAGSIHLHPKSGNGGMEHEACDTHHCGCQEVENSAEVKPQKDHGNKASPDVTHVGIGIDRLLHCGSFLHSMVAHVAVLTILLTVMALQVRPLSFLGKDDFHHQGQNQANDRRYEERRGILCPEGSPSEHRRVGGRDVRGIRGRIKAGIIVVMYFSSASGIDVLFKILDRLHRLPNNSCATTRIDKAKGVDR